MCVSQQRMQWLGTLGALKVCPSSIETASISRSKCVCHVASSSAIEVHWQGPEFDGGDEVSKYSIQWDTTQILVRLQRLPLLPLGMTWARHILTAVEGSSRIIP